MGLSCDGPLVVLVSSFLADLQCHACLGVIVGGIRKTWPNYDHLLFNIVDLIGSAFALLSTSSLVINSYHLMYRSLRKYLVWKLASFGSIFVLIFLISEQARV